MKSSVNASGKNLTLILRFKEQSSCLSTGIGLCIDKPSLEFRNSSEEKPRLLIMANYMRSTVQLAREVPSVTLTCFYCLEHSTYYAKNHLKATAATERPLPGEINDITVFLVEFWYSEFSVEIDPVDDKFCIHCLIVARGNRRKQKGENNKEMVYFPQHRISILLVILSGLSNPCLAGSLTVHSVQRGLVGAKNKVNFLTHFCSETGNYAEEGKYGANLHLLLSNLTLKAQQARFYNFTVGETGSRAYGLFRCRGDKSVEVCHDCVKAAVKTIQIQCPFDVAAIVWYEECIVRYANSTIFGVGQVAPVYYFHLGPFSYDKFDDILFGTLRGLTAEIVSGNSTVAFATKVVNVTDFLSLECYVDCTPDIIGSDCNRCLEIALDRLETFNDGGQYAVLLQPSCRLRYEFHGVVRADSTNGETGEGLSSFHTALLVILSSAATVICLSVVLCLYKQKGGASAAKFSYEVLDDMESIENLQFDFAAIKQATENFLEANLIGKGGFGAVYKGTLPNGQLIAVKRLSSVSKQGSEGFKTEACLLAKLQHRNLIKLYGFCVDGVERLLVYELLPNKSLDRFLADPNKASHISWETRFKIIIGVARGLQYLHEDSRVKIVHRDLKCSNILLDADLNPKISDFGLARLFELHQTQANTSTVVGTFGYIAPEYVIAGHFSAKSDVYSFGVILLELVSGRLRYSLHTLEEEEDILSQAWRLWTKEDISEFVDSAIRENVCTVNAMRCVQVGLLCVQEDPSKRPDMASVITMLNIPSITLPLPTAPLVFDVESSTSRSTTGAVGSENGVSALEIDF